MLVRPNASPRRPIIPMTVPSNGSASASGSRTYLFSALIVGFIILFSSFWDFQTLINSSSSSSPSSSSTTAYHRNNEADPDRPARFIESTDKTSGTKSVPRKKKRITTKVEKVKKDEEEEEVDNTVTVQGSVVKKRKNIVTEEDEEVREAAIEEEETEEIIDAVDVEDSSCVCPINPSSPSLTQTFPSSILEKGSVSSPISADTSSGTDTMDRRNPFTMPIPKIEKTPQLLHKRPARRPPKWLEDGECPDLTKPEDMARFVYSPLAEFPLETLRMDAMNSFMEEHSGDILLGDCSCPLLDESIKPFPEWQFDCGAYDWRILSELAPWHGLNITHDIIDLAFRMNTANLPPTYHLSVKNNQFYMKIQTDISVYHENLLSMLRKVSKSVKLPDMEFVMHYWDHAKVPRGDTMPVFGWSHEASRLDITSPFSMYWNKVADGYNPVSWYPETCPPFEERREKIVWRGGCMGADHGAQKELIPVYKRTRLNFLTEKYPDIIDAGVNGDSDCGGDAYLPKPPHVSLYTGEDVCKHKYLLLVDGNGCSGRSSLLFGSGSVVFKPDSPLSEHFYHGLIPWVHYVPVREYLEDLPEQIQWIKDHPKAAKCIAENGRRFARQHLNEATVSCYWWRLLSAWARQQTDPSRAEEAGLFPF